MWSLKCPHLSRHGGALRSQMSNRDDNQSPVKPVKNVKKKRSKVRQVIRAQRILSTRKTPWCL